MVNTVIFPDDLTPTTPEIDDTLLISDTSDGGASKQVEIGDLPTNTATQAKLDLKADKTTTVNGYALSSNITLGKLDVGLGNVDNTADLAKPISTLTQAEIDTKQNTLIPGTNITIVGDTINSIGGPAVVTDGFNRDVFTATAGQTLFNLTFTYTPGSNEILVFVNGNILLVTTDYTETSTTSITLASGVDSGDIVQVVTGVKGDTGDTGPTGDVATVVGGTNITVDSTDSANPIVNLDTLGTVQFDTTNTTDPNEGQLNWDSSAGCLQVGLEGGNVTQQVGRELYIKAKAIGSNILNGQVVYVVKDVGTELAVSLADNSSYASSIGTLAICTEDVNENDMGLFTTFGLIHDIDTSAYNEGDILYLGTNGNILNTKPLLGEYVISLGYCAVKHTTIGSIFVNVNATPSETKSIITKEPTGFAFPGDVIINYDSTTRKITLTGNPLAFWRGVKIDILVSGWESEAHDNTNGIWFLYYNGSDFVWSQTLWTFDLLMIAFVNFGVSDKWAIRETHGLMPWQTHKELHEVISTYRESGGDLSNYTLSSTTATDRRPYISDCIVNDEDLQTIIPAHTSQLYTKMFLTSTGVNNFTVETADIVPLSGNQPYYNQFTGGAWQQTLMANNSYQALWLVAIPMTIDANSQKYRFVWVQGQTNETVLANTEARQPSDVNVGTFGVLATESVFIAKVIIRYTAGNWRIYSVTNLTGTVFSTSATGGAFLSSVSTDTTLSGSGTVSSPLTVTQNYATLTGNQTIAGDKTLTGQTSLAGITITDTNATAPTGTSTYLDITIGADSYRILAQKIT